MLPVILEKKLKNPSSPLRACPEEFEGMKEYRIQNSKTTQKTVFTP